jgi:hypothetical protein
MRIAVNAWPSFLESAVFIVWVSDLVSEAVRVSPPRMAIFRSFFAAGLADCA